MAKSINQYSAILYHNADDTIFLIDTPHSIAIAQESWSSPSREQDRDLLQSQGLVALASRERSTRRRWLLSTAPPETPFPSTEPKSCAARAKVLERIPLSEQRFHGQFIQPLVESVLHILRAEYQTHRGQWCLPRRVRQDDTKCRMNNTTQPAGRQSTSAKKRRHEDHAEGDNSVRFSTYRGSSLGEPPAILSSTAVNAFESLSELRDSVVKNVSSDPATLAITSPDGQIESEYIIPPRAHFVLCTLPLSQPEAKSPLNIVALDHPIPAIPGHQKFNLLLFDPPWPNRSVGRSGHYQINNYSEMDLLTQRLRDILQAHSYHSGGAAAVESSNAAATHHGKCIPSWASLAAIWITNAEKARRAAYDALTSSGFRVTEEWVWVKTTVDGQPVSAIDGLWRKPYEILVIGRADQSKRSVDLSTAAPVTTMPTGTVEGSTAHKNDLLGIDPASIRRRVIAAVPDLHSRKPNLKEVFERVFFLEGDGDGRPGLDDSDARVQSYSALEVFARNLTAGWWSCGNEVLKFNARECWVDDCDS